MKLGCDPEIFLMQGQNLKAVCGLIGAYKDKPLQVPDMPQGFTFQEDNVAFEFNIPPATTCKEFQTSVREIQRKFLATYKTLSFSKLSCTVFPDEELNHPMAKIFGCEPDYNAWTGMINKSPKPLPGMRAAGGHVHVETELDKEAVIRAMDLFLTVPSVLMDDGEQRRTLGGYGKAGAHRRKSYGVEHRSLSNFWIFDDRLVKWVWDNTERALSFCNAYPDDALLEYAPEIIPAINDNDKELAKMLIDVFDLEVL